MHRRFRWRLNVMGVFGVVIGTGDDDDNLIGQVDGDGDVVVNVDDDCDGGDVVGRRGECQTKTR